MYAGPNDARYDEVRKSYKANSGEQDRIERSVPVDEQRDSRSRLAPRENISTPIREDKESTA